MLGVCDENEENRKNDCQLKYFAVKRSTLEACRRTVTQRIAMIFTTRILHSVMIVNTCSCICTYVVYASSVRMHV